MHSDGEHLRINFGISIVSFGKDQQLVGDQSKLNLKPGTAEVRIYLGLVIIDLMVRNHDVRMRGSNEVSYLRRKDIHTCIT